MCHTPLVEYIVVWNKRDFFIKYIPKRKDKYIENIYLKVNYLFERKLNEMNIFKNSNIQIKNKNIIFWNSHFFYKIQIQIRKNTNI